MLQQLSLYGRLVFLFCLTANVLHAQNDSLENERLAKMITLSEVIVRNGMDVNRFIQQVKNDTTFYKGFRNLHLLSFTSLNDIRIKDKKGTIQASLFSKTRQIRKGNCRSMEVLQETTTGNFYNASHNYNYYTAELYAGLFFTNGSVCGENNIVGGVQFSPNKKTGIEKHKEQLKMLFFNPGKRIPGIPLIGDKINIFDPQIAKLYDFILDRVDYNNRSCYLFTIKAKEDLSWFNRNDIVIDNLVTWFDAETMEVLARNYDLSYNAGVYDFDVHMEVELTHVGQYLVPRTLRYNGSWDVAFKKRERGVFTATLFDFK